MTPREIHRVLIGHALVHLRTEGKRTQSEVAQGARMPQTTLSRIERGDSPVELFDLIVLLDAIKHTEVFNPPRFWAYLDGLDGRFAAVVKKVQPGTEDYGSLSPEQVTAFVQLAAAEGSAT